MDAIKDLEFTAAIFGEDRPVTVVVEDGEGNEGKLETTWGFFVKDVKREAGNE